MIMMNKWNNDSHRLDSTDNNDAIRQLPTSIDFSGLTGYQKHCNKRESSAEAKKLSFDVSTHSISVREIYFALVMGFFCETIT